MNITNLITSNHPVRELCDYFHVFPPWHHRLENIVSKDNQIQSLDLVKTKDGIDKIIHIRNVEGLGLTIADIEESLTDTKTFGENA